MKFFILVLALITTSVQAENKKAPEKTLELKVHINKMHLTTNNLYRLELAELAAAYHAETKFETCLKRAVQEQKEVTLKVTAYSLIVQDCK